MWKREIKFHPDQTPAQRAYQIKSTRRDDARMQRRCDALKFWTICSTPLCRRRHRCSGDPQACFTTKWEVVPEEVKEWHRAVRTLHMRGLPIRQAIQQAAGELARVKEDEAAARRALDAALPKPAAPPEVAPPTPRVRRL
jgi:hypothetical protein